MELTIKEEKANHLLKRKEVEGELTFKGATPSNKEVCEALAKKMNTSEERIRMQHMFGSFGKTKADFTAHVYETKEQLDRIEPKIKEKKAEE